MKPLMNTFTLLLLGHCLGLLIQAESHPELGYAIAGVLLSLLLVRLVSGRTRNNRGEHPCGR